LFLKPSTSEAQGRQLARKLAQMPAVRATHYISRAQALAEFKKLSGFGDALNALNGNPLPAVVVGNPKSALKPAQIRRLVAALGQRPEVAQAKLDQTWLKLLRAVLATVQRGALVVACLLAVAVIIIIGNTIRLDIQNRKEQIQVMKLLGASDGFIRRPFLYLVLWYGLWGGVLAGVLIHIALWLLAVPVARLAGLYNSEFSLAGLGGAGMLLLLIAGSGLGLLGSWWSVGRHLRAIHPH
jgi:cell division transport system permease protein